MVTSILKKLSHHLQRYFESTDIHGLHYLAENRSFGEKLFWAIIQLVSVVMCITTVVLLYHRYLTTPVVISYGSVASHIRDIAFPAVTICPQTKVMRKEFNYETAYASVKYNKTLSPNQDKMYQYLFMVCDHNRVRDYSNVTTFDDEFYEYLIKRKPPLTSLIKRCLWMDEELNCSEVMSTILTDEGICYTFNLIDRTHVFKDKVHIYKNLFEANDKRSNWASEDGYPVDLIDVYPKRAIYAGNHGGLMLYLRNYVPDNDPLCKRNNQGFKLHTPHQAPLFGRGYVKISMDTFTSVMVEPQVLNGTEISSYDKTMRNCYFEKEVKLKHHKLYSYRNCMKECKTKYVFKKCGCVSFFMIRTKDTPICGSAKYVCIKSAEEDIERLELEAKLKSENYVDSVCGCKFICTDLTFHYHVSSTPWNWRQLLEYTDIQDDINIQNSVVRINFEKTHFLKKYRHKILSFPNLIAKCGGVVSLLTGVSIISIVEIVYFLSLRIICNTYMYRRWWGQT